MSYRTIIWLSVLILLSLVACENQAPPTPQLSGNVSVERGEVVYLNFCVGCHQLEGAGQPGWEETVEDGVQPAPPLNGDGNSWQMSDEELLALIREGAGQNMPGYAEVLPPDDIQSVLLYMKSLWSEEQREAQAELNEE